MADDLSIAGSDPTAATASTDATSAVPGDVIVAVDTVSDPGSKLDFLYKVLDDSQNTVRFLDSKAAYVVALLLAMTGKVLTDLGTYFPWTQQPWSRQCLLLAFGAALAFSVLIVARVVFPTNNPGANTSLISGATPRFFLCELEPRRWARLVSSQPKFSRLAQDHGEYVAQLAAADVRQILVVLSGEVLKVSYIRQIKAERMKALAYALFCTTALFACLEIVDARLVKQSQPFQVQLQGPVTVAAPPLQQSTTPAAPVVHQPTAHRGQRGSAPKEN
jgi:hypothetical protein